MTNRNLTVQLDEEIIARARAVANKRGTSISSLVAHMLEQLADDDQRYEAARERALELMDEAASRGGRTWTRDDRYDR